MGLIEPPPPTQNLFDFLFKDNVLIQQHLSQTNDWAAVVKGINDEYLYWDKVKYKVSADLKEKISPELLWQLTKNARLASKKNLSFADHSFYLTQTDILFEHLHQFDLHLGGSLGGREIISDQDQNRYLIGSIMEESIASSQIEGAVTSRLVAKEMLRKNRTPRNTSERMIFNNYQTIRHIAKTKDQPLTADSLLEIHRLMTDGTLDRPEEIGQFRQHDDICVMDVVSGDVVHTPPLVGQLADFVEDICKFFNEERANFFLHPVIKASIIHFMIGYFHPFTDGNGRTARALFYWYLLKKGYWLTEYLSISRVIMQSRTQYYKAFQYTELDENDLTYFVLYQVKILTKSYDELKKYLARKSDEKQRRFIFQKQEGLSPRQVTIVSWLIDNPEATLSIKEIQNRLAVADQTARFDVQSLLKSGYLSEISINKKERHYVRGSRFDEQK